MTIQELAAFRFVEGKKNHPLQTWELMTPQVRVAEALEELADTWNYVEDFENLEDIRCLLSLCYKLIKQNEPIL
jgi:hypothetical protein